MDSKKWQYDINMLQDILKVAVKNKELKKNAPIELISNIIISQLYGMMLCWCMSNEEFNPKQWTEKFCNFQLKKYWNNILFRRKNEKN